MKKYVREILKDLHSNRKDFIPAIPKAAPAAKTTKLDVPPEPPVPEDLNNQQLSSDPAQRVRQLDYQAQKNEERESS